VDGNRTHAARLLGIGLRTLRNKLRAWREAGVAIADPLAAGDGGEDGPADPADRPILPGPAGAAAAAGRPIPPIPFPPGRARPSQGERA
jgi:hypothetical protein